MAPETKAASWLGSGGRCVTGRHLAILLSCGRAVLLLPRFANVQLAVQRNDVEPHIERPILVDVGVSRANPDGAAFVFPNGEHRQLFSCNQHNPSPTASAPELAPHPICRGHCRWSTVHAAANTRDLGPPGSVGRTQIERAVQKAGCAQRRCLPAHSIGTPRRRARRGKVASIRRTSSAVSRGPAAAAFSTACSGREVIGMVKAFSSRTKKRRATWRAVARRARAMSDRTRSPSEDGAGKFPEPKGL